ncbi:Protein of unknown function (DUF3792) [Acididesulfobacillus acetoxydans]|uniref:TIGR04086 family membrane protein n=1 Tax=Acididesulfobacillus acetoxydans TaxID=1561005 RepID=A0A8S0X517_9FIRM|nr:TIGR04086 family membrane protein [Acididesulfobacillus acetoxydans]CAA7601270.1 Protein of unknown function (DUF3792) [Acididesulfobacillus acetoxydans]CEJ08451.1 Protein of unknown function (DUF3792) [Acididesulfobacillus acetoxydans]
MSKSFQLSLVFKGILLAAILALILALGLGVLLSLTSITESGLAVTGIMVFSIFIASVLSARQAGSKGLYYGLLIGLGYVVLLLLVAGIFRDTAPSPLSVAEKLLQALVAGGIGGITGVLLSRG